MFELATIAVVAAVAVPTFIFVRVTRGKPEHQLELEAEQRRNEAERD